MTPEELNVSFQKNKDKFNRYINTIKNNASWDLYTIVNPTLIKNPFASNLPKNYFSKKTKKYNIISLFIKNTIKFYFKTIYLLLSYFIALILYKLYFTKKRDFNLETIIDVYGLVDKINQNGKFNENYLIGIYDIFKKFDRPYVILVRPYQAGKNPFKLKKFFKIINEDSRNIILEYGLLEFRDFTNLFLMILVYPLKILKFLQKEKCSEDIIFNQSLIQDLQQFNFSSFTRYILGKKLSKIQTIQKIYSWSEFQVLERSFNYAIRKNCNHIELTGLQFYLNYETYLNSYVDDIDYLMMSSPHKMLVNGKYFVIDRKRIKYETGVALRYKPIFKFPGIKDNKNILLLGSYEVSETKYMIDSLKQIDNLIFINHPAVNIKKFGKLPKSILVSSENVYKLFQNAKLVIGTTFAGTIVEAVACGISAIIVASQKNLTANPLVKRGKGKIWDIAFSADEIPQIFKKLIDYRIRNQDEIINIADWYKNNLFEEPTEENIVKVFDLNKDI